MTIIFPMAGMSSRFAKAGYDKPKYMLDVGGNSVFYHSVYGFNHYFESGNILFICRDVQDTEKFIHEECIKMGLRKYQIITLDFPTEGQAETVYLGLNQASIPDEESLLVFNIDTFRPNFRLPKELDFEAIDGYLEVFEADGDHWSFVLPASDDSNRVKKTTEKERISSLCSSGLYYFKSISDFRMIFETIKSRNERNKNEFYIAPMYNYLIKNDQDIRYSKIGLNEIVFCGTPDEYDKLINSDKEFML